MLNKLIEIAHHEKFLCRPLRIELEYLPELDTPCILHWNLNHFVVLKKATRDYIEIVDPANGVRTIRMDEVSRRFTGIVLELRPNGDFEAIALEPAPRLRTLTGKIRGLASVVAHAAVLSIATEIIALTLPLFAQWVVDQVLLSYDLGLLTTLAVGFLLAILLQATIAFARGYLLSGAVANIGAQWIERTFAKMLSLPTEYFERRHLGDVASRFGSIQTVLQVLSGSFFEAILSGVSACITLFILFLYSPYLGLAAATLIGGYLFARLATVAQLRQSAEEMLNANAQQQSSLYEAIRGVRAIKLGNREAQRTVRFGIITATAASASARLSRQTFAFSSISLLIQGALRVVLIWISAALVVRGQLTAGMLVAIVAYAEQFAGRTAILIDKVVDLRVLRLHLSRIAELATSASELTEATVYSEKPAMISLEINNVSFRYSECDPWIFRKTSFTVKAGESLAIVGPSGCGKSTLMKLMLGLMEASEGEIKVNGLSLHEFGLASYRELVGAVMQDDSLFAGTVAENISFFEIGAAAELIKVAAKTASIHDEILAMPLGYETNIGDMGSAISGGQKQRLLLARALYKRPVLLMLDEATSHLDIHREHAINDAIRAMSITRVIVAHRPQTIASADRVIELDAIHGMRDRTEEYRARRFASASG